MSDGLNEGVCWASLQSSGLVLLTGLVSSVVLLDHSSSLCVRLVLVSESSRQLLGLVGGGRLDGNGEEGGGSEVSFVRVGPVWAPPVS